MNTSIRSLSVPKRSSKPWAWTFVGVIVTTGSSLLDLLSPRDS
jgi:hypothetical protein